MARTGNLQILSGRQLTLEYSESYYQNHRDKPNSGLTRLTSLSRSTSPSNQRARSGRQDPTSPSEPSVTRAHDPTGSLSAPRAHESAAQSSSASYRTWYAEAIPIFYANTIFMLGGAADLRLFSGKRFADAQHPLHQGNRHRRPFGRIPGTSPKEAGDRCQ